MKSIKNHAQFFITTLLFILVLPTHHIAATTPQNDDDNQKIKLLELCAAASQRDLEKITLLVRKGVSINAQDDNGYTPLHYALLSSEKKVLKTVKRLIEYGADITIKAHNGDTPLDLALETNNPSLQDLLIFAHESHEKVESTFPVDISFLIADIKYDHGALKICEFGEGPRSYFKGHEQLYGQGEIWRGLWNHLQQFELPIWYVGTKPTSQTEKQIALATLIESGGTCVASLYELYKDPLFQKVKTYHINNTHVIKDYQGIIIFRQHKEPRGAIAQFKRKNPGFLVLDNASTPFVNSKNATNQIFRDEILQPFKPRWNTYHKKYSKQLAQTIINDLKSDTFVIKPLNAANGWGVIIVTQEELDQTLQKILLDTQKIKFDKDISYSYWGRDNNKEFLVEEYAPSHLITVNKKQYDATMRMVFIMTYDNQKIHTSFIGSYWKLPTHAITDKGSLTERHKSKIGLQATSSAKVNPHDAREVKKKLLTLLPTVYAKMLAGKRTTRSIDYIDYSDNDYDFLDTDQSS